MHCALAPGEEPISDPLEILSTAERAVGWQPPVHDRTRVPRGEYEVANPESSSDITREEEVPSVPEKEDDGDGIIVHDWAYQAGFTSNGRAKGKGERRTGRSVEETVTDVSSGGEGKRKQEESIEPEYILDFEREAATQQMNVYSSLA